MSDLIINNYIRMSYPFERAMSGPANTIVESTSGRQQVFQNSSHDRMKYVVNLLQLTPAERATIWDFYRARLGSYDTFLFKDRAGYDVARNQIGVGNGTEDEFQFIETIGSRTFTRRNLISGTVSVWVDNTLKTEGAMNDYTITYFASGVIKFNMGKIPAAGKIVEAAGEILRRCRFTADWADSEIGYENISNVLTFEEVIGS